MNLDQERPGAAPRLRRLPWGAGGRSEPQASASGRRAVLACLLLMPWGFAGGASFAAAPQVVFDIRPLVECRDVAGDDLPAVPPGRRLVEARITISSLVPHGDPDQLEQYLYHMESPHAGFVVVDHLPNTTLATDVVGNLGIEKKDERTRSLGASFGGQYDKLLRGDVSGSVGAKEGSTVKYDQLPPLELVAASGTTNRGAGVYFKLRPAPRISLEGTRQFVLLLEVPQAWRGDWLLVHCQATGRQAGLLPLEDASFTRGASFLVALYAAGDEEALAAARELIRAEQALRTAASAWQKKVKSGAYPTPLHRFGAIFDLVDPKVPPDWYAQIVLAPAHAGLPAYKWRLPPPLQQALDDFAAAKDALADLSRDDANRRLTAAAP